MMEPVPENEQQAGPPAVRPPSEPLPAPRSTVPEQIDPEAVRQFQQFQQFQELMRQQGGAPLLPPARPPVPLWKKVLGSKLVRRLILLAIILVLASYAYNRVFGTGDENLPASITGGGKTDTNLVLPKNPYETVRKVYERIAYNDAEVGCGMFDETVRADQQFAQSNSVSTCAEAIAKLSTQVKGKNGYAEVDFRGKMGGVPTEDTIEINSCDLGVSNGPRLGVFTVHRIKLDQWIITGYRNETCP
jgi:hypothetical protein